jgi:hypothetical protein
MKVSQAETQDSTMIPVLHDAVHSLQGQSFKDMAETVQAVATTVALFVGGAWTYTLFVRKRQRFPRATTEHSLEIKKLSSDLLLVHLAVRVKNLGEVLLQLSDSDVQLRQLMPLQAELERALIKKISAGQDSVAEGESEVDWPGLGHRECDWKDQPKEIEPGEDDEFHYDFVISSSVQVFSAYSYFTNVSKKAREIGWNRTTLHDTSILKERE